MAVETIKTKVERGEFEAKDFGIYLMAIKELAIKDNEVREILREMPDFVIQFSIFGAIDVYLQLKNGNLEVVEGVIENPAIKFEMTDVVATGIIKNEIDPISAYLSGDIKINGETVLAMKLKPIIEKYNKILGFKVIT